MPGDRSKQPIPWHSIFAQLSQEYRWTPDEIARLTFAQLWFYWNKEVSLGGVVSMEVHQGQAFAASRQEALRRAVDGILGTDESNNGTQQQRACQK